MKIRHVMVAVLLAALWPSLAPAQQQLKAADIPKEFVTPFPGFKIAGNFYYVGTYDIASYLLDTGAGLILINTGGPGSYALIKANINALGFKTSDIRIITATHAHWDHVSDIATFKKDAPAAKVYISERDATAVESGNNPDMLGAYKNPYVPGWYHVKTGSKNSNIYEPVRVDVKTRPGDHIKLGDVDMTVLQAYGHTPGATSFQFMVRDRGKKYNVYIVNTADFNPHYQFLGTPEYPGIAEDYKSTLALQVKYKPDIWVSSHASQFNMHDIYKPGDPYNPSRFGDLALYRAKIAEDTAEFERKLALDRIRLAEAQGRH